MKAINASDDLLFDFSCMQEVFESWPECRDTLKRVTNFENSIYNRIYQLLEKAIDNSCTPCFPDLIPLIRQVAMKRSSKGNDARLKIKLSANWPERKEWNSYGFVCHDLEDRRVIVPENWRPEWLPVEGDWKEDIFADSFSETVVRSTVEMPIDPFIGELTGYKNYSCPGQKEAVLSALFMPPGSTLVVNLPTGAGKTLVAQAPILMNGLYKGLSIVIVPTTALAIDQSRRMNELLAQKMTKSKIPPLAWHGELKEHEREQIKNNIRQGRQGILFTSPEAATGALLPSLYVAAKAGLLRNLIVDEAHLIAQWGDSFRPAFQSLAGLRRGLLDNLQGEPFRTILMSATFSPQNIETLEKLFGPSSQIQMVSAVHLRPEPRYWVSAAPSEEAKRRQLIELLRHLPRPFIFYVTERKDAATWEVIFNEELGHKRIATFTGNTPNRIREKIIDEWASNMLDGIIATSAFGVGIDKSDVRSVIHATVPESLDRFYQEVGRGGRDGKACISVSVYSPRDLKIAMRMVNRNSLSTKVAFERWEAMVNHSRKIDNEDDLREIDLRTVPSRLTQETDYNKSWNMSTLILMSRAGLIELSSSPPNTLERTSLEDDVDFEKRVEEHWDEYYSTIPIRTLDAQHLKKHHFDKIVSNEQSQNQHASNVSLKTLLSALRGETEMGDAIASLYESNRPGREVIVSKVCRGCPSEGKTLKPEELVYQTPIGVGIDKITQPDLSAWKQDFPEGQQTLFVYYPRGTNNLTSDLLKLIEILVATYGVQEIVASGSLWDLNNGLNVMHRSAPNKMLIRRDLENGKADVSTLPLPRVTLLIPWDQTPVPDQVEHIERPMHVIVVPEDIKASYEHKKLVEIRTNCISLGKFLERSTQ